MDGKTKELLKEYREINKQIDKLTDRSKELELKLNEIRYNCKVGKEIEFKGLKGIVSGFDYRWVVIHPYKKDGTPHKYTKTLFDLIPEFDLD